MHRQQLFAIIVASKVARDLADHHGVTAPPRHAGHLLLRGTGADPLGARALLLGSIFALSPILVVSMSFYPMALALAAIVAIFLKHQMGAVAPAPTVPDTRPQGHCAGGPAIGFSSALAR
jgi:hypothetical protein